MKQAKQKTSVSIIAVMMSLIFVFALAATLFVLAPATSTAAAAGTRAMDTLTIADMYANRTTGKYGNFSWDPSKLQEITSSSFTISASVAAGYQPFYICWTKPAGTAYPSKLNYGYTIGTGVNGDSASKKWTSTFPSDVSFSGIKTYPVSEVSLNGDYDKIYFCMGHSYMYDTLVVTSITFQPKINTVKVTATAGTGVQSVYLSKDQNATSGSNSGTNFDKGDTVYAFATLAEGYKRPNNNWTLVSGTADSEGAIYRVNSSTMGTSDYNFGTISATAKTKLLARDLNGGGNMSDITLQYGQTADLTVPTREGYNFLGWNTNADGLGTTYGDGTNALLTAEQVNAIISDDSISTLYAMWKIDSSTVMAFIDAIPDPVVYTQDCKNAIAAARDGYDSLGEDEKLLVTNYDKLTAAESTYNAMQADKEALDAYKTEQKGNAGDLALEGDSAACEGLISDAKDAIDALSYDYTKTLDENKAAVDAIVAELADALALQRDKDVFDAYKAEQKGNADDLAVDGDSAACEELIAGAKEAIDALAYDEAKGLDGNKAAVDAIVAELADALALQRDKDVFDAYKAEQKGNADELAIAGDSAACEELIAGAKEAIDALAYDEDKDLDGNKAAVDAIVVELADALALQRNKDVFDAYKTEQKGEADELALEGDSAACEELIVGAKEAIDALAYDEDKDLDGNKAMVDAIVSALANALALQRNKDVFDAYKAEQKGNADELAVDGDSAACEELIAVAKEAIDALAYDEDTDLDGNKATVDAIVSALANALVTQRNDEEAAASVSGLIGAIGEVEYTQDSKDKIDAARKAYDALTADQKALIAQDLSTLTTAESKYETLRTNHIAAEEVKALIDAIGEVEYTEESKGLIEAAKEAYAQLTEEQKALVGQEKANELSTDETTYQGLEDAAKAGEVKTLIANIGTVSYPGSKEKIEQARAGYEGLTDPQKELVDNYDVLTEAERVFQEQQTAANTPKKGLSASAIAGIVIGSVAGACCLAFLILFLLQKKKKDDKSEQNK